MFYHRLACVLFSIFTIGCAVLDQPTTAPTSPSLAPNTLQINTTLDINLTPELAAQTGLPPKIRGHLDANAKSESVSEQPLRSRHTGTMRLIITDETLTKTFADLKIDVNGESDGGPAQGLEKAFEQFFQAASLMVQPVSDLHPNEKSP